MAQDIADEWGDIYDHWIANTTMPAARLAQDGQGVNKGTRFDPPEIDTGDLPASTWQRLTIVSVPDAVAPLAGVTRPGPVGLGALAKTYREGMIIVQIFCPAGFGLAPAQTFINEQVSIWFRQTIGIVRTRDAIAVPRGKAPDHPNFEQVNVEAPYYVLTNP